MLKLLILLFIIILIITLIIPKINIKCLTINEQHIRLLSLLKTLDKVLNDIDGLSNPSTEHLAIFVWNKLVNQIDDLSKISISEDEGTGTEYSG